MSTTRRRLECCVCGADAGRWEQHWNRDTGYGVCLKCVRWMQERGTSEAEILDLYGTECTNFGDWWTALVEAVEVIAPQLKAGLSDPAALDKCSAEETELASEIAAGRMDDAYTEACDVAYYAAKAILNGLCSEEEGRQRCERAAEQCRFGLEILAECVEAKYAFRVRGQKDKDAERAAVKAVVAARYYL